MVFRARGRAGPRGSGDRRRRQPRQAGERPERAAQVVRDAASRARGRDRVRGPPARPSPATTGAPSPGRSSAACAQADLDARLQRWRGWYVSVDPHLPSPARRPARAARLRDRLGRGARARQHAQPHAHARGLLRLERNTRYWRSLPFPAARDQVSFRAARSSTSTSPARACSCTRSPPSRRPTTCTAPASAARRAATGPACAGCWTRWRASPCSAPAGSSPGSTASSSRRHAAVDQRHGGGNGHPGARARRRPARRHALLRHRQARRSAPSRRCRRGRPHERFAGGVHYLQYSFAPRLYIFNAFLQSVIGLHDFGRITGDQQATELFEEAEPEAREEIPLPTSATGRATPTAAPRPPRLPRAAARVPPVDVHAPARRALLHVRRPLPRLPDRSARADIHRPRRTTAKQLTSCGSRVSKLSAVEARSTAAASSSRQARHLPPRRRRLRVAAARPRHLHRPAGRQGAAHRPRQEGQGTTEIEVEPAT